MRTWDVRTGATRFGVDNWIKASASGGGGSGCVEIEIGAAGVVRLRDSKHPQGGGFAFSMAEWRRFLDFATR